MARTKKTIKRAATGRPAGYAAFLDSLKKRIQRAQAKAVLSANREVIQLYWDIGRLICERQEQAGWGQSVLERLADDLRKAFPGVTGFSRSNVFRMRAFYLAYRSAEKVAQAVRQLEVPRKVAQPVRQLEAAQKVAQPVRQTKAFQKVAQAVRQLDGEKPPAEVAALPWGHNVILIQKVKDRAQRLWYAAKTAEHGWSRAVLAVQIETGLYARHGKAVTNFEALLPQPQSDLAQQSFKDPYLFDFLTLREEAVERDLEAGLIGHIQKFLLELGAGFAFVGRQMQVTVGDSDFCIDLLFYHLKLRCFVVIDLKMRAFTPEDAGKMNFYLTTIDEQLRHKSDAPTIGLILCKTRDRIIAEYALRDIAKPIGVAQWQTKLVQSLPASLKGSLPSIEDIEAEFGPEES